MARTDRILGDIDKSMKGLEIAPWFAPLVPKAKGYNVRILDIFDRDTLIARASADPILAKRDMARVEVVDYVGSATEIAAIIPTQDHGTFDYIVSSHNFEHLPNPIKFLQGCATILKPGGILSMAVPDRRGCFDFFRPNTQLGDWLDAYITDRKRPTDRQVFDLKSLTTIVRHGPGEIVNYHVGADRQKTEIAGNLADDYRAHYVDQLSDDYHDTHCTVMSPASLELLLTEIRQLGLVNCKIEQIVSRGTFEFTIRLRFDQSTLALTDSAFATKRLALCNAVLQDYRLQVLGLPFWRRRWLKSNRSVRAIRSFGRRLRGKPDL